MPPDPPKFIRDAMTVNDIDGTSPLVKKQLATRDGLKCDDIQGAQIRKAYSRSRADPNGYDNIAYNDVTKKSWVSTRHTNPLDPTYRVRDDKGTIGGEAEKK